VTAQRAPSGLGPAGRRLWRRLCQTVVWRPDELEVLEQAARTADQVAELERAAAQVPVLVLGSRKQLIVNPVLQELRLTRQALAAFLSRLDVPEPADPDALTPSQRGRRAAAARWHDRKEVQDGNR